MRRCMRVSRALSVTVLVTCVVWARPRALTSVRASSAAVATHTPCALICPHVCFLAAVISLHVSWRLRDGGLECVGHVKVLECWSVLAVDG